MQADQTVSSLRPGDEDRRRRITFGPRFDSFAFDSSDLPARRPHGGAGGPSLTAFKTGGPTPALIKAEVPWSVRRGTLSGKDRVLKTVKGILNKLTMESYNILKGQLTDSGITTADILKGVVSLIHDKAVLEPMYRPMYARLCSDLDTDLPPIPSGELDGKITFKRVLLNKCQEAFETRQMIAPEQDEKERMCTLGNIYLIGELWKHKMVTDRIVYHVIQELLGRDGEICSEEEIVEVVCQFLIVIGKRSSRLWVLINDKYSSRLEELTSNLRLAPRLRFMVRDAIGLIQYMCK